MTDASVNAILAAIPATIAAIASLVVALRTRSSVNGKLAELLEKNSKAGHAAGIADGEKIHEAHAAGVLEGKRQRHS